MNAAFGGVSAGGIGTPESDVTQSGGGPCAFVATQAGGNPGGVTPSKYSPKATGPAWTAEGHGEGRGAGGRQDSTRPQPVPHFGGPGVPHWFERKKMRRAIQGCSAAD